VDRGTLWVPTLRELGDHLRAMEHVTVRYRADGSALVTAPSDVEGATFVVPRVGPRPIAVLVDKAPPDGSFTDERGTTFWIDLRAGRPARVTLHDEQGAGVALLR